MAGKQIGILFGVEGGASVNGASGSTILTQLRAIARQISNGGTRPTVTFGLNVAQTQKTLQIQLNAIASNLKIGTGAGSSGKNIALFSSLSAETATYSKVAMSQSTALKTQAALAVTKEKERAATAQANRAELQLSEQRKRNAYAEEQRANAIARQAEQRARAANALQTQLSNAYIGFSTAGYGGAAFERRFSAIPANNAQLQTYLNLINQIKASLATLNIDSSKIVGGQLDFRQLQLTDEQIKKLIADFRQLQSVEQQLTNVELQNVKAIDNQTLARQKLINAMTQYQQKYQATMGNAGAALNSQFNTLLAGVSDGSITNIGKAQAQFVGLQASIRAAGGETQTLWQSMKSLFGARISYGLASYGFIALYSGAMKLWQSVVDIDTAMTELKKVTDETASTYNRFLDEASDRAQKLGATISDVINASADFARLGYNIDDAATLADAAVVYKNVGDGINNISDASESIISTMKAFGIEAENAMQIVDVFNDVGNKYAISSKGVGDALLRSASAMASANSTMEETVALATAANTTVQNTEKVGTALKTNFYKTCLYVQKCA